MDEEDLNSLPWQPFSSADAARREAEMRRTMALGFALWGRTPADLERQLLAPHPETPPGYELADYRNLAGMLVLWANFEKRLPGLRKYSAMQALVSGTIVVGGRQLTMLQARSEVVRRAIEYLER